MRKVRSIAGWLKILFGDLLSKEVLLIPAITLTIFIIFHEKFEDLFSDIIIKSFLVHVESNWLIDLVLTITTIVYFISIFYKFRKEYHVSTQNWIYFLFISIIYGYYRFQGIPEWSLKSFVFNKFIYYSDIIILPFLGSSLLAINKFKKTPEHSPIENVYIEDNPISFNREDMLSRVSLAKQIADNITNTKTKKSFAIGISGNWGSGKTSFINLIEECIADKKKQIIIHFNPWMTDDVDSTIKDFFKLLEEKLSQFSDNISKEVFDYSELLIGKKDIGWIALLKKMKIISEQSIENYFNKINKTINKTNKKIIVFIDDLDRLDKKEIMQVLKLIRNSANFTNTFFIVGYDKSYIINSISFNNSVDKKRYLEKIFQVEYELPLYEDSIIIEKLVEYLKRALPEKHHDKISIILDPNAKYIIEPIMYFLKSLRDVIRFINSFPIVFSQLEDEIHFPDLFCIELIKLKFPQVIKALYRNQEYIFYSDQSAGKHIVLNILSTNGTPSEDESIHNDYSVEKYLSDNKLILLLEDEDIICIVKTLEILFGHRRTTADILKNILRSSPSDLRSITNPSIFYRYFSLRIFGNDISEKDYSKYRTSDFSDNIAILEKWIRKGLRHLLYDRIMGIEDIKDREDFENIVLSIFYISNIPLASNEVLLSQYYPFMELYALLKESKSISDKYYSGNCTEYRKFLLSIFNNAKSPYSYESEFLHSLNTNANTFGFPLNKKERVEINLKYLQKYILSNSEDFKIIYSLFLNCMYSYFNKNNGKLTQVDEVHYKAKQLILDYFTQKSASYLFEIVTKKESGNYRLSSNFVPLFNSRDKFVEYIMSLPENDINNEYKQFVENLKKDRFTRAIEFQFNYVKLK